MIVFLTVNGIEFQTPGDKVEYKPPEKLGGEALFEARRKDSYKPVAQVRTCEVVGWFVLGGYEEEPE